MNSLRKIRGWMAAGLLAAAALVGTGSTVQADHYCSRCHYEWVVRYVPRSVPYTQVVTEYDYYGYPHYVTRTYWRTVRVPVRTWTLVCY